MSSDLLYGLFVYIHVCFFCVISAPSKTVLKYFWKKGFIHKNLSTGDELSSKQNKNKEKLQNNIFIFY